MSKLRHQLDEDRSLRDSARELLRKEFDHVRRDVAPRALGERVADRVGERVDAASDKTIGFVRGHGGALAAAGAAIASAVGLWLARKPLFGRPRPVAAVPAERLEDSRDEEFDKDHGDG